MPPSAASACTALQRSASRPFFLLILFTTIIGTGWTAFLQSKFLLNVTFAEDVIAPDGKRDEQTLRLANWDKLARAALYEAIGVGDANRAERRDANGLLSRGIDVQLRDMVLADPDLIGQTRHDVAARPRQRGRAAEGCH